MYFLQKRSENISNLPELDSKRTPLKYRSAVLTTLYHVEEEFTNHEIKEKEENDTQAKTGKASKRSNNKMQRTVKSNKNV
jgi:hypothetical protein